MFKNFSFLVFFLFFFSSFLYSQDSQKSRQGGGEELSYTLEEYLKAVEASYLQVRIQALGEVSASAVYQQYFYSNMSPLLGFEYTNTQTHARSLSPGGDDKGDYYRTKLNDLDINITQPISYTGTGVKLGYKFNNTDANLAPAGPGSSNLKTDNGSFYVGITQSLLQNGPILLSGFRNMEYREENVRGARAQYNAELEDIIIEAISAYYDFLIIQKQMELTGQSVDDAQRIYNQNLRKVGYGSILKYDFYDSEIFLRKNRIALNNFKVQFESVRNKILIYLGKSDPDRKINLVLKDTLSITPEKYDESLSLENALAFRNDLKVAKSQQRSAMLSLKATENYYMPKLDFFFNVFLNGNRHTGSNTPLIQGSGNPNFNVGFNLVSAVLPQSFTVITKQAKADYDKANLSLSLLRDQVTKDVGFYIKQLNTSASNLAELKIIYDLRTKSLAERRKRFNNGKLDFDAYVRYYDDVRQSQTDYLKEIQNYRLNDAKFKKAEGTLLRAYNINSKIVGAKVGLTP